MSKNNLNLKNIGNFKQDCLVPNNFGLSQNNAKYDKIIHRRTFRVPVIMLANPLQIIAVQNKISSVKFYEQGMMVGLSDHNKLMTLLLNSVKYN